MNIVSVAFHGAELYGFERPDGVYVALKPIAESIGLDWSAQYRRVQRDPILSEGIAIMATPFGHGGEQQQVCLRIGLLNGWLFTIDSNRIQDDAKRDRILIYQRECFDVLAAHFNATRAALAIGDAKAEPLHVRKSLVTEARQTFSTQSARELWFSLGLPIVPSMTTIEAQADLFRGGANG